MIKKSQSDHRTRACVRACVCIKHPCALSVAPCRHSAETSQQARGDRLVHVVEPKGLVLRSLRPHDADLWASG